MLIIRKVDGGGSYCSARRFNCCVSAVVDTRGEASAEVQLEPIRTTLATCPIWIAPQNWKMRDPKKLAGP